MRERVKAFYSVVIELIFNKVDGTLLLLYLTLFIFWDQSHVTIVWNTRETGDINEKELRYGPTLKNWLPQFKQKDWATCFKILQQENYS